MYLDTPDISYTTYEDDTSCWSFCNDFVEFAAPDLKLEYLEPEYPVKVEYPGSPEAVSPGSTYEHHPMMLTSPPYSNYEAVQGSPMHAPGAHHSQQVPGMAPLPLAMSEVPQFNPQYHSSASENSSPMLYPDTPVSLSPHGSISGSSSGPMVGGLASHHMPVRSHPYPVVGGNEKVPITPDGLSMKIQNMGFHPCFPMVRSVSDKSLKLWMPLDSLDESRRNVIMQKAIEKDLKPSVVHTHLQMFPDNDWPLECPQELRDLPVIGIQMGGSALDSKSKRVKRPLNSFMIYRKAQTQRARLNAQRRGIKINHQTISSIVGLLWQTESAHVHEFFSEAAGVEKYLHGEEHPNYKFKPRKKSKVTARD